jgi:hypothetical protein
MWAGLLVATLALVLLAVWLVQLRVRTLRLGEELDALRRELHAEGGRAA